MKKIVSKLPQYFSSHTKVIPLLGVLALLLALPLTLNLIEQSQDNRQQAARNNEQFSIQQHSPDPNVGRETCQSVGGRCETESEWAGNQSIFAAASVDGSLQCPQKNGQNQVCIIQERANESNQTCDTSAGFSCDFKDQNECAKSVGEENCESEPNARCQNGNACMKISGSSAPTTPPSVPSNCSIASDGKQYCCPEGTTYCGKTSNTSCPLCVSAGQVCSTGQRWSVAQCSNLGGGPTASCNTDTECSNSNLPHSCTAEQTVVWQCVNNNTSTGKHCVHTCTSFTP